MNIRNKSLVSTKQLAEYFSVTRQAIYKWRKKGMPVFINNNNGKLIRYELDAVIEWINRERDE
jgi:phage terminase Nu1 subunit (DNA packaging protein)